MANLSDHVWRCGVCGYIHRGTEAPENCPVCGAPKKLFEKHREAAPRAKEKVEQWRCLNCGYVHSGPQPPEMCPVCGAPADRFEPVERIAEKIGTAERPNKVVILGGGIAGITALESLHSVSPEADITLVSKEASLPYYRLNLSRFLAGEIDAEALPVHPEHWYAEKNVRLLRGKEATSLSIDDLEVELSSGEKLPFERLVITIGAHPFRPPFSGSYRDGVTSFRSIEDAEMMIAAARKGTKSVCIGGGLLGLETAGALARRGADVTLLEGHNWLMPRQLNQKAGEILMRHVAGVGVKLLTAARTAEIVGDERVRGVLLEGSNDIIQADLVVIATGIRSNSYLARLAKLDVNQGIVVNNTLMSSHPAVLAAGDVAEHRGMVYGIWNASQYMGNIAGMNAAGLGIEFGGIPRSNTLKVLGLDLFSIGQIAPEDASFDLVEQEAEEHYFYFLFRDGHLVGSILLGDTTLTANVKQAVETRADFSGILKKHPTADNVKEFLAAL